MEDAEILAALKSMGRLKAQGYFYGQPEDASAVRARLKAAGKLTGTPADGASPAQVANEAQGAIYRTARP